MITFDRGKKRFLLRSVAVILDQDRVLLHRGEEISHWSLPGGRVELMETARETLKREMVEELKEEVTLGRLLWTVENFFSSYEKDCHEVGLYFLTQLSSDSPLYERDQFNGWEGDQRLIFQWHSLDNLQSISLLPEFLPSALRDLPSTPQHLVQND